MKCNQMNFSTRMRLWIKILIRLNYKEEKKIRISGTASGFSNKVPIDSNEV